MHSLSYKQDRQCTYKRNIEARSCNHCCSRKAKSITYYECVSVALGIQHAMCMRNLWHVHFSTLSHKLHDSMGKKVGEYKNVCLNLLCNFCLKHSSL
jgi:hypothetical protein